MSKEIAYVLEDYIKNLKKNEIKSYSEIPEEYHNEHEIIAITRQLGLRKTTKCGYNVITKLFFAEETIVVSNYAQELSEKKIVNTFTDFQAYWGEVFTEAGADLIIGTHPHVCEKIE